MNAKKEGWKFFGVLLGLTIPVTGIAAEEMDHSQHQHHQHTAAAQAGQHVHHLHGAGQWMFEYRFMRMEMEDLLRGDESVDSTEISGATRMMPNPPMKRADRPYMMAPTEMTMDMHMLMVMYGVSDKLALMAMFNYLDNEMDMVMHMYTPTLTFMGDMFGSMETSGTGDTQVGAMYRIDDKLTTSFSVSIPTGSIDEKVTMQMSGTNVIMNMPMSTPEQEMLAPYSMQLGTGTYDLIPSITYVDSFGKWTFGTQAEYRYHIGENDNDYTWGNKLELDGWGKYAVNSNLSLGGRVNYMNRKTIDGQDPDLNPMMTPLTDNANYGGKRMDLALDVTAQFGGHTLGAAYAVPVKQDVDGIQMEVQSILTLSYQYMM